MKVVRESLVCSYSKTGRRFSVRASSTSSCEAYWVHNSASYSGAASQTRGFWYGQRASACRPHFKEGM